MLVHQMMSLDLGAGLSQIIYVHRKETETEYAPEGRGDEAHGCQCHGGSC